MQKVASKASKHTALPRLLHISLMCKSTDVEGPIRLMCKRLGRAICLLALLASLMCSSTSVAGPAGPVYFHPPSPDTPSRLFHISRASEAPHLNTGSRIEIIQCLSVVHISLFRRRLCTSVTQLDAPESKSSTATSKICVLPDFFFPWRHTDFFVLCAPQSKFSHLQICVPPEF